MSKIEDAKRIAEKNAEIKADLLKLCAFVSKSDIPDEARAIVTKYYVGIEEEK